MKPRHLTIAFLSLQAALRLGAARAATSACPGTPIESSAEFRARWPDLASRIEREFTARTDVDACARVVLRLDESSLIAMRVTLADGRVASRTVARRDDVIPMLQALLLVPHAATVDPPTPSSSTESAGAIPSSLGDSSPFDAARALIEANGTEPNGTTHARRLGVELSLLTGARLGGGQLGFGAGAVSLLEVHDWLVGFCGRADSYRAMAGGDPDTVLELAVLAGRRFDFGGFALDFVGGPAVALQGVAQTQAMRVSNGSSPPPPPAPATSEPSSEPALRLMLGARLGLSPRSILRTFVGIDSEIGPSSTVGQPGDSTARLPGFLLGLALGATVGTP